MPSAANIALYLAIAALVFYKVIYTQMRGTLLSRKSLVTLPLILTVLGAIQVAQDLPGASAGEFGLFAVDVLVLAGIGVLRSTSTTLSERDGTTFQKGSMLTIGLWVLTVAVRVGFITLATALGIAGSLTTGSILFTVGVSIGVQNAVTYFRIQQRRLPLSEQRVTAVR